VLMLSWWVGAVSRGMLRALVLVVVEGVAPAISRVSAVRGAVSPARARVALASARRSVVGSAVGAVDAVGAVGAVVFDRVGVFVGDEAGGVILGRLLSILEDMFFSFHANENRKPKLALCNA